MKPLFALTALLISLPCGAQTCKYIDAEGRVTYSNVPIQGAKKVTCLPTPKAPAGNAPTTQEGSSDEAAAAQPRPQEEAQRAQASERRHMLEAKLAAEEEQLAQAKKALAEQESIRTGDERNYQRVLDRLKPYQDAVAAHEKNIASIKRELANLP